jgi:CHAT domain-containing protein/tetratricopeptide (TPR) repeat protein
VTLRNLMAAILGLLLSLAPLGARTTLAQGGSPSASASYFADAELALNDGRPQQAADLLRALIARWSGDPSQAPLLGEAALRLSRVAQLSGDFTAAERPLLDAMRPLTEAGSAAQAALAANYIELGNLALAKGALSRAQIALLKGVALARNAVGPRDPMLLSAELSLSTAEIRAFRLDAAAARLAALEPMLTSDDADLESVAALYQATLAELHFRQYAYEPALAAQRRAYDLFAAHYGTQHPETARAATSLATGLFNTGQYKLAETTLLQAIATYDANAAFFGPALATSLVNLGQVYYVTGRPVLAVTALTRADDLATASLGPGSQIGAAARLHRGYAHLRAGDLASAIADLDAAIAIWSDPSTSNPRAVAGARVWLAEALRRKGDLDQADVALNEAAATLSRIFGGASYAMSDVLLGQGEIALGRQEARKAVTLFAQATAIRTEMLGVAHISSLEARANLALAMAQSGEIAPARVISDEDVAQIRVRVELIQAAQSESAIEEIAGLRRLIGRHIEIAYLALQQAGPESEDRRTLLDQSLALAQLARSSAAGTAIAGLAQRFAASDPAAASAMRAVQESLLRWQLAARQMTARAIDGKEVTDLRNEVAMLAEDLAARRDELAASHPEIAAIAALRGRSAAAIAAELAAGEALVAFISLEDHSFGWVVSRSRVDLVALPAGASFLQAQIGALRVTLNPKEIQGLADIRAFDGVAARALHDALLAPLGLPEDVRHLIIVPDGNLQSLPFAALLTADYPEVIEFADYRRLPWLIHRFELSVLPEIGALVDLRASARPSAAGEPFFGIGDPVLTGSAPPAASETATPAEITAALMSSLAPLPESRDELLQLAATLQAAPDKVLAGADASEARLKAEPLDRYRVIAFATHGLMAGDFGRLREPGLVLTPPAAPAGADDGLLTVGEIAGLRLDADWVVLSACNTAADDGSPGAEGLSGLARAFFFAGSRSLLVSQWEVLSIAAVQLTTGIFQSQATQPGLTRAGALRASMLAMLAEDQQDFLAHPIFWAPFELVGEGG